MKSYDIRKEERVWNRVMATEECHAQAPDCLNEGKVLELIIDELRDCGTYRSLAKAMRGCDKGILMGLAEEEACHARKLSAVYFLMTGRKACPDRPKIPCITCINTSLRQRYQDELHGHAEYLRLSKCAGEFSCVMAELAKDELCHSQKILCLLKDTL